jgi:hypothetical protein
MVFRIQRRPARELTETRKDAHVSVEAKYARANQGYLTYKGRDAQMEMMGYPIGTIPAGRMRCGVGAIVRSRVGCIHTEPPIYAPPNSPAVTPANVPSF